MSDYIIKSALVEQIKLYEKELSEDRELGVDSDDEMMLFAIANQETAIYRIKRCIQHELPTISETEITRNAFERVLQRLEKVEKELVHNSDSVDCTMGILNATMRAIKIVKEECGINE